MDFCGGGGGMGAGSAVDLAEILEAFARFVSEVFISIVGGV